MTYAEDLFVAEMPKEPDLVACVYDTGGMAPDVDNGIEAPSFQVLVRGARGGYEEAHLLATNIRTLLHGMTQQEVNGARYLVVWAQGDVAPVGTDQAGRPLLSINFQTRRVAV